MVWGETDQFRALDVINPLDFRWHWARENWEDIRIPLWMVRGIYDIGKLGFLEESFVEGIWIPGDFESNEVSADPRRPWGFFGQGLPERSNTAIVNGQILDLKTIVRNREPDASLRSSELAVRLKSIWGGLDFSLNYFWTLSDDTGFKTRSDLARVDASPVTGGSAGTLILPVDLVNPRSHVVGVSANYSEERYTQTVFRIESTYTTGIPVQIAQGAPSKIDPDGNGYDSAERTVLMLAFDRPTWFRPLNRIRTLFLSGQIFWRRHIDYNRFSLGAPSDQLWTGGDLESVGRIRI